MKPVGRLGEAQEMAHQVRHIVENDFFSSREVEIDGGIAMQQQGATAPGLFWLTVVD